MKLGNNKRGFALNDIPTVAILLVVLAVTLGIGATVLTQTRANQCDGTFQGTTYWYNSSNQQCYRYIDAENTTLGGTYQWNATSGGLTSINTLASWQPTFAVIIAASVVVGIIAAYLMFGRR